MSLQRHPHRRRAGIVAAIHSVAEPHQPLAAAQLAPRSTHPCRRPPPAHRANPASGPGAPPWMRPGEGAPRAQHRARYAGPGRGHHPRGEAGRAHPAVRHHGEIGVQRRAAAGSGAAPCSIRSRSAATGSDGSGGSGACPARMAQQRGHAHRQRRGDAGGRAVVRQHGKAEPHCRLQRPRRRHRQPGIQPRECRLPRRAERRLHAGARQALAGEAVPQQSDGAFIAIPRHQFRQRHATHPQPAIRRIQPGSARCPRRPPLPARHSCRFSPLPLQHAAAGGVLWRSQSPASAKQL